MDQPTFTHLTGMTLDSAQVLRFPLASNYAKRKLEIMLGYPLNPDKLENQYIETGKLRDNDYSFCLGVAPNVEDLDAPDEVVGKYRLFSYNPSDVFLAIDPATAIHKVKLVRDNITFRTFESVTPHWENGNPRFTKSLEVAKCHYCYRWCWCDYTHRGYQLAVDADWAFAPVDNDGEETSTVPIELEAVLAGLVYDDLDPKTDIKSENITSYSYTRFDKKSPEIVHADILQKYAGPNGTAKRQRIV